MPHKRQVREVMIPLQDYPHIPYWFTLRQAVALVRESALKYAGVFEPRTVLVFNEKYQIVGILTLRDILKGLEPAFLKESELVKADPTLAIVMGQSLDELKTNFAGSRGSSVIDIPVRSIDAGPS